MLGLNLFRKRTCSVFEALEYIKRQHKLYIHHRGKYTMVVRFDGLGDVVEVIFPQQRSNAMTLKIGEYEFQADQKIPINLLP